VSDDLHFELGNSAQGPREFVITADANPEHIPIVDQLIAAAPSIAGWTFVALKQPQGFGFEFEVDGVHVDPSKMLFLPLVTGSNPALLGLRVAVPGYSFLGKKRAMVAGWLALQTGLGERVLAERIVNIEFCRPPRNIEQGGFMPLQELPQFIEFLDSKMVRPPNNPLDRSRPR
jgi:hypothetical protein